MNAHTIASIGVAAALTAAGPTLAGPTPTYNLLYKSRQIVTNPADADLPLALINTPFLGGLNGDQGFLDVAINNSGDALVHCGLFADTPFDEGMLRATTGLSVVVAKGREGLLMAPSPDHATVGTFATEINNNGTGAFAFSTGDGEFTTVTPTSGVFFDTTALVIEGGASVTAAGFDPGTTWNPITTSIAVAVNDSNAWVIAHSVTESGQSRDAIVVVQTDATGAVTGQTLVAKVGGPVPASAETWTELSTAPHAVAINNAGDVIFSGRTSGGREGIAINGTFVVETGDGTPVGGLNWGSLFNASVDLNNTGDYAFRGLVGTTGTWTETGDAGEDAQFTGDAQWIAGSGAVTKITGTLTDDHDVDVYRIAMTDPTSFSATTVNGATSFDSVLYLLRTFHNFDGRTRTGLARNNDASPGVTQSSLGSANVPLGSQAESSYFLAISTPNSYPTSLEDDFASGGTVEPELWQRDPGSLAIDSASGTMFWPDPSEGVIRTASTAGVAGPDLTVSSTPTVLEIDGEEMATAIGVLEDGPGSRVYFFTRSNVDGSRIQRVNLDGTNQEVIDPVGAATDVLLTDLAVDSVNQKLYWCKRLTGQIARSDLDGNNSELLVALVENGAAIEFEVGAGIAPASIAVDGQRNAIYFYDAGTDAIRLLSYPCPCEFGGDPGSVDVLDLLAFLSLWFDNDPGAEFNGDEPPMIDVLDLLEFLSCWFDATSGFCGGTSGTPMISDFVTGASATAMIADPSNGTLYWTRTDDGRVQRASLNGPMAGVAVDVVVAGAAPNATGIAIDGAGKVYWTDPCARTVRSANTDGTMNTQVISAGPDTGDRTADGPGYQSPFASWIRKGAPSGPSLAYEIDITGAGFFLENSMIVKNNSVKIAQFGDLIPAISPSSVSEVGAPATPIRINDDGNVLWRGEWRIAGQFPTDAIFLNQDVVLDDSGVTTPTLPGFTLTGVETGPGSLDMSDDGTWAIIRIFDGTFSGGNNGVLTLEFGP